MSILSGYKKFKKYIKTSSGFQLQSLWTSANTVEADDKRTIQTKVGAINGISSSETANSAEIAASTALTNKMNGTINNLSRDLKFPDGTGFYPDIKDGVHGYNTDSKRGADTFIPFRADEVAMFEITIPNTTEDNILVTVTDKLGFKDAPNVIFVSAANHLTIDAIYNPYKTITTDAKTMVKLCAYAPTQKIEYRAVDEVFPTITKDSIAIKAKAFVSGVGNKVAHVVIARFV